MSVLGVIVTAMLNQFQLVPHHFNGLALIATLPALWWGVIRKLATGAIKPG